MGPSGRSCHRADEVCKNEDGVVEAKGSAKRGWLSREDITEYLGTIVDRERAARASKWRGSIFWLGRKGPAFLFRMSEWDEPAKKKQRKE
jgi:hypothetical protein